MQRALLICSECGHREEGYADKGLMNKIKMLNHVTKAHPEFAEEYREELKSMRDHAVKIIALQR